MVAIFKNGKSLAKALRYNEHKVSSGKAKIIGEGWFGKDHIDLTLHDKAYRLNDLAMRNERALRVMHISLNFSNGDHLTEKMLKDISREFLEHMDFGGQPFLAYQHFDAGHPHVHLITTHVRPSGDLVNTYDHKMERTFKACRALEKKFGLQFPRKQQRMFAGSSPVPVQYGKGELEESISEVVNDVLRRYMVTSFEDFNTVLSQFNVVADRGAEGSERYKNGGLVYHATREGKIVGKAIKASQINGKPMLNSLADKFQKNERIRNERKERLKKQLDSVLVTNISAAGFLRALKTNGISVILHYTNEGQLRSVTYIDNFSKVVFDGNELGHNYSPAELAPRFANFHEVHKQLAPAVHSIRKNLSFISSAIREHDLDNEDNRQLVNRKLRLRF